MKASPPRVNFSHESTTTDGISATNVLIETETKFKQTLYKITQKIAIHLPEDQWYLSLQSAEVFIIQSADLSQLFGCDLEQKQTGVILKGKGPHYLQYSYGIIRIHSLIIYSHIIGHKKIRKNAFTVFVSFPM